MCPCPRTWSTLHAWLNVQNLQGDLQMQMHTCIVMRHLLCALVMFFMLEAQV